MDLDWSHFPGSYQAKAFQHLTNTTSCGTGTTWDTSSLEQSRWRIFWEIFHTCLTWPHLASPGLTWPHLAIQLCIPSVGLGLHDSWAPSGHLQTAAAQVFHLLTATKLRVSGGTSEGRDPLSCFLENLQYIELTSVPSQDGIISEHAKDLKLWLNVTMAFVQT